jgi:aldehyde:ferredoxin oxidoreductase
MFSGGYLGRLLRINLTTRQYSIETIPDEVLRLYLGARGLGAEWYAREVPPQVKPFDPENKLAFFTGPMTGTLS